MLKSLPRYVFVKTCLKYFQIQVIDNRSELTAPNIPVVSVSILRPAMAFWVVFFLRWTFCICFIYPTDTRAQSSLGVVVSQAWVHPVSPRRTPGGQWWKPRAENPKFSSIFTIKNYIPIAFSINNHYADCLFCASVVFDIARYTDSVVNGMT